MTVSNLSKQQVVRQSFLWCMGAIYLFAFTSLYVQVPGLFGVDGLLPASYVLHDLSSCHDKKPMCKTWAATGECQKNRGWMLNNCLKSCNSCHALDLSLGGRFIKTPTLLWLTPSVGLDSATGMEFICLCGIILSMVVMVSQRCRDMLAFLVLWFLYYSLMQVGQIFLQYQWDGLLLEAGFLSIIVAPWNFAIVPWRFIFFKCKQYRSSSKHHNSITMWLVKWLLFRLMFASGVVKLTWMDPAWWSLTALSWHYESQCIPTPVAWYFHKLPHWFHKLSTVLTYVIEIGVPFLFFAPVRALRIGAYFAQVSLQLLIILTGNYNFFNLLTIVLCVSLLDDQFILSRLRCSPCCKFLFSKCFGQKKKEDQQKSSPKNREDAAVITKQDQSTFHNGKTENTSVDGNSGEPSVPCQLVENFLDWLGKHHGVKVNKAKTFFHSRTWSMMRSICVIVVILFISVVGVVCTVKWFNLKITQADVIHSQIVFTPDEFLMAVKHATVAAIWIGFFSLLTEILTSLTRCCLERCGNRKKFWLVFQTVAFSVISLWMFALSLEPFTDVSLEAKQMIPAQFSRWFYNTQYLELAHAYGLFRSMTGVGGRPEIIIIGGNSLNGTWKEYNFLYKPGEIHTPPPFVAPHQPRLDWQMWFAALEPFNANPWLLNLLHKLILGKRDVQYLMGVNPFPDSPPMYIRTRLYTYHYSLNSSNVWNAVFHSSEKAWWSREYVKDYTPFTVRRNDTAFLENLLQFYGLYRKDVRAEPTWGYLHLLIESLRGGYRCTTPSNMINMIFVVVLTALLIKFWWRKTGKRFFCPDTKTTNEEVVSEERRLGASIRNTDRLSDTTQSKHLNFSAIITLSKNLYDKVSVGFRYLFSKLIVCGRTFCPKIYKVERVKTS